jgi:hypothetical protein
MMLLWLPKYPKQKRQLAALAMAVLQELKIKSIVHYWSTSKKLFITAPVSQFLFVMQDRKYQKKKVAVEKFIKKFGKVDHHIILNNVDVDYDTLMRILSELRNEGRIS